MEYRPEAQRKRKISDEDLGAGFKKALVSAVSDLGNDHGSYPNTRISHSNVGLHGDIDRTSQHQYQSYDRQDHRQRPLVPAQSFTHIANPSAVDAASVTILSTMAGLLANAGGQPKVVSSSAQPEQNQSQNFDQGQHKQHDDNNQSQPESLPGVGEDVLKMQQQLQQQVPLDPSTNTRMMREQILESMTSIPAMQMQLEESLKEYLEADKRQVELRNQQQQQQEQEQHSVPSDPSILATLNSAISHPASPQALAIESAPLQTSKRSVNGNGKKKTKAVNRNQSNDSLASNSNDIQSGGVPSTTLEEHFKRDVAVVTSDNPLHTKWLMATALKDKGISYKTGTFSSHEDELIRQTIRDYVARHNMPEDAIQRWFQNGNGRGRFEKNDLKALWVEIAVRLQNRPLLNIYLHVRRMFHPQNNVGTWSKEDDEKLIMLYAKHKGQWTTIGTELGRMADSCRDRYRNHLKDQNTMVTGPWQPHEDERLLTIMQDLALQQGKTNILDSSPMWTLISERMQGTRTRHQCRHRYSQTLQPRLERGEWTAPSSAAAAAAAAVAANAAMAANVSVTSKHQSQQHHTSQQQQSQSQQQVPLHDNLSFGLNSNNDQSKTKQEQDVLMLAAALQGVLPDHGANDNMLWTQAMTTSMQGSEHGLHGNEEHQFSSDGHHHQQHSGSGHDPFSTAAFTSVSIPMPTIVPKAPKGPIRRRCGLQQQLDSLKMIQEEGYTDHTDIKWSDIAQRLRDKVEEGNAIQLARIIQTHDQLDSKKQQHLQEGDSAAAAAAAAAAAMAAAVSAAQAEAVASLQRVPAANQIARTFMSSRCKIEGYREMTLQQVIVFMMQDVERRIQHRRGGSANAHSPSLSSAQNGNNNDESGDGAASSSSTAKSSSGRRNAPTTGALIQQQVINDAAQQAAIAALSAQFPFLQQHQQQQQQSALAHALSDPSSQQRRHHHTEQQTSQPMNGEENAPSSADMLDQSSPSSSGTDHHASAHQTLHRHHHQQQEQQQQQQLSAEQQAQHQHELEQQQHNRDLAEQMLSMAFSASEMNGAFSGAFSAYSPFSSSSSMSTMGEEASMEARYQEHGQGQDHDQQSARQVLNALHSGEFATDTSDEEDEDVPEGDGM
ncbi:RNA polymerase I enhancer binding protein [Mortierella sp. GBA30]|nr:RNA polymerase I enhancer binding protein [Mortierella sp. GBA30]